MQVTVSPVDRGGAGFGIAGAVGVILQVRAVRAKAGAKVADRLRRLRQMYLELANIAGNATGWKSS